MLLLNLLLAGLWMFMTEQFSMLNAAAGFGVGAVLLALLPRVEASRRYRRRIVAAFGLAFFIVWEIVVGNVMIAYRSLRPLRRISPGIVALELEPMSQAERLVFSCILTLTPGTIVVDVAEDGRIAYVHVMHVPDVERFERRIKQRLERLLLELTQ